MGFIKKETFGAPHVPQHLVEIATRGLNLSPGHLSSLRGCNGLRRNDRRACGAQKQTEKSDEFTNVSKPVFLNQLIPDEKKIDMETSIYI